MQRIKIFRKEMDSAGNGAFRKVEETVNAWLEENPKFSIVNMFSANMFSDYGDGDFVLIAVYTDDFSVGLS